MPSNPAISQELLRIFTENYSMPNDNTRILPQWNYKIEDVNPVPFSNEKKDNVIKAARETFDTLKAIFGDTAMLHSKGDKKLSKAYKDLEAALDQLDGIVKVAGKNKLEF